MTWISFNLTASREGADCAAKAGAATHSATAHRLKGSFDKAPVLHLLEQVPKLAADGELVFAALERQGQMSQLVALRECDVPRVDHGAAVNLPENRIVELLQQFSQRHANDAVALERGHSDRFVFGLEPKNLIHRNELDGR